MMWIYWVIAGVIIFVTAALTIGREARRLDRIAPRVTYQIEEAIHFVADRLPVSSQSHLTYEELNQLIVAHLNWLSSRGLLPEGVVDRQQDIMTTVVITEDYLVAYLMEVAEQLEFSIVNDVDIAHITTSHIQYLRAIGCLGPEAHRLSDGD